MEDFFEIDLDHVVGSIGDFTDDAILVTDAEPIDGPGPRIVWVNKAFCRMTGYEPHEVIGKTPRILQGPDTKRADLDKIRAALDAWRPVRIELKNYRKDGSAFWVDLGIQVVTNAKGWHRYWVAIQRETTERHERDKLLFQTSQILENAPIALGLMASDGRLTYANEHFQTLIFGDAPRPALPLPYDSWLRRGLSSEVHGQFDGVSADAWRRRHIAGLMTSPFRIEQKLQGAWHEFRRLTAPGGDQLLIGENIEARVALQAQLRHMTKMDAMGQLTSGVAHDFNNILAVILGNAELLEDNEDTETDRDDFIGAIVTAVLKGRALTASLLSFARKSNLEPEPAQLQELLPQITEMFERTSTPAHPVVLDIDDQIPRLLIDPNLFQTAVLNLLLNARDSLKEGGTITIGAAMLDPDSAKSLYGEHAHDCVVNVFVQDGGEGMPDHVLKQSVEPFFTTKKVGRGSGLGLSMVKGFVEQSGGILRIESAEKNGTRANLYFPADRGLEDTSKETADRRASSLGLNILVVEDEAAVRRILIKTLERCGCTVTSAATGDEAYAMRNDWHAFDLLLTDLIMPGSLQGDQLAQRFAEKHPNTPVLILSGNPEVLPDLKPIIGARTGTLLKPLRRDDLIAAIKRLTSGTIADEGV
jgi:PAS domain S-box-containing protein